MTIEYRDSERINRQRLRIEIDNDSSDDQCGDIACERFFKRGPVSGLRGHVSKMPTPV